MACSGFTRRARRLLPALGLKPTVVGPNQRHSYVFENAWAALVLPLPTVKRYTTRATLLAVLVRVLFGRSRVDEPATVTEVWNLPEAPKDLVRAFNQPGVDLRMIRTESGVQIRRAPWMRIIGPVIEKEGRVEFVPSRSETSESNVVAIPGRV